MIKRSVKIRISILAFIYFIIQCPCYAESMIEGLTASQWFKKGSTASTPEEKIDCCTKVIKLNPKHAAAYNNRGVAYYKKGNYGKAWEDVLKAQSLGYRVHPKFLQALCDISTGAPGQNKVKLNETAVRKIVLQNVKKLREASQKTDDLEAIGFSILSEMYIIIEKIGKPSIPILLEILEDKNEDWKVRSFISEMLKELPDERLIKPLLKIFRDKKEKVSLRSSVAGALAKSGGKEVVPIFIQALQEPNVNLRMTIIAELGALKDKRAVQPLKKFLNDSDEAIRVITARALEKMENEQVIAIGDKLYGEDELIKVLKDREISAYGKVDATEALGEMKSKKAIPSLTRLLDDKNEDVWARGHAAKALGQIGDEKCEEVLIKGLKNEKFGASVRGDVAEALGIMKSKRAISLLGKFLKTRDRKEIIYVGTSAAKALGQIGDEECETILIKALESEETHPAIKISIMGSLGRIKSKKAVPILIKFLKSKYEDTRAHAARALNEIGDKRAMPALKEALKKAKSTYLITSLEDAIFTLKIQKKK